MNNLFGPDKESQSLMYITTCCGTVNAAFSNLLGTVHVSLLHLLLRQAQFVSAPLRAGARRMSILALLSLPILALAARWREGAEMLTGHGCVSESKICLKHADELEATLQEWESEVLTIAEAAAETGYSEAHLRELAREGTLPDGRESGSHGPIRIRRGDVPRRPGWSRHADSGLDEFVQRLVER